MAKAISVSGEKFSEMLDQQGFTQESLAQKSGVSRSAIASYSTKRVARIGIKSFNALAVAFGSDFVGLKSKIGVNGRATRTETKSLLSTLRADAQKHGFTSDRAFYGALLEAYERSSPAPTSDIAAAPDSSPRTESKAPRRQDAPPTVPKKSAAGRDGKGR